MEGLSGDDPELEAKIDELYRVSDIAVFALFNAIRNQHMEEEDGRSAV